MLIAILVIGSMYSSATNRFHVLAIWLTLAISGSLFACQLSCLCVIGLHDVDNIFDHDPVVMKLSGLYRNEFVNRKSPGPRHGHK